MTYYIIEIKLSGGQIRVVQVERRLLGWKVINEVFLFKVQNMIMITKITKRYL
jgi:hypothetical protein